MAIWVDERQQEPFNGILVVMNPTGLGDLSYDEREIVAQAVKKAIANGWAVIRMYDSGAEPAPDWMDDIEEHCFARTPSSMGLKKCCPMTPSAKSELLSAMPKTRDKVAYVGLYENQDGKVEFIQETKI